MQNILQRPEQLPQHFLSGFDYNTYFAVTHKIRDFSCNVSNKAAIVYTIQKLATSVMDAFDLA